MENINKNINQKLSDRIVERRRSEEGNEKSRTTTGLFCEMVPLTG